MSCRRPAGRQSRGWGPCRCLPVAALLLQLAHGQVLEDAVLDLLQIVVIFVEHLARPHDVQVVFGDLVPGQLDHPFQVGLDQAVLGSLGRHHAQARQLAARLFVGLGGMAAWLIFSSSSLASTACSSSSPSSFWMALELLAQIVLALRLLHRGLGFGLQLLAQLQHFQAPG